MSLAECRIMVIIIQTNDQFLLPLSGVMSLPKQFWPLWKSILMTQLQRCRRCRVLSIQKSWSRYGKRCRAYCSIRKLFRNGFWELGLSRIVGRMNLVYGFVCLTARYPTLSNDENVTALLCYTIHYFDLLFALFSTCLDALLHTFILEPYWIKLCTSINSCLLKMYF